MELDKFKLPVVGSMVKVSAIKTKKLRGNFLKGPIPIDGWLEKVFRLSPCALKVALAIHHFGCLSKSIEFKLSPKKTCERFKMSRNSVYRGLQELEQVNVIECQRRNGAHPLIKIVYPSGF